MGDTIFSGLELATVSTDSPAPGLARLTLNRPAAMNAYSFAMTQELLAGIAAFRDDDALKVLILTGAGERAFCTGGDVSGGDGHGFAEAPMGHGREMREGMQAVVLALRRLDKPSIAMVRGFAVAGGLALALACDFRLAAASARLGDTSNKVGLLPDEGGAWLFPRAMGHDRALKMVLLSEIYGAEEAARLGLVTEVVADGLLEARTLEFAAALATRAPLAVRLSKMMMARAGSMTLEESLVDAQMAVMVTNPSGDVREGVKAFFEKRPPKFEGR
ncbi:enoyl-CoA hydratase [Polymorphobacter glacialis]|uniref:Enoyl-CoA hydratase n=1 Tax=Sandarakinorhabdus glacialis TaxID=1614636 RepID=A0A917EAG9_9SPHN|nr:enoyl-CoA hydratase-related protein [Polymorphobacter glacialis]GGE19302.1 enoyl-CoA hydratase [Polymorphobacter glacialis]